MTSHSHSLGVVCSPLPHFLRSTNTFISRHHHGLRHQGAWPGQGGVQSQMHRSAGSAPNFLCLPGFPYPLTFFLKHVLSKYELSCQ